MTEQNLKRFYKKPYLFSVKEIDAETGNYYYGARYYDPRLSIFLSVDPLAEKYPSISPYAYVANNPIKFIDPDGRDWVEFGGRMIYDERVNKSNYNKYYEGSIYRGNNYSVTRKSDGFTTTYGFSGRVVNQFSDGTVANFYDQNNTPAKVPVNISNYVAVETKDGMMINKVSEGNTMKYPSRLDGWIGASESTVLILKADGSYKYIDNSQTGSISPMYVFNQMYPNARNIDNEKAGYEGMVMMGSIIQPVGSTLSAAGNYGVLASAGETTPLVIGGYILQAAGFGVKSYGNYKLGNKEKIWKDALKTLLMKSAGPAYKKITK